MIAAFAAVTEPLYVSGCTDFFLEFDPYATIDDGSCGTSEVEGCIYDAAENFNPAANVDDGSCTLTVHQIVQEILMEMVLLRRATCCLSSRCLESPAIDPEGINAMKEPPLRLFLLSRHEIYPFEGSRFFNRTRHPFFTLCR